MERKGLPAAAGPVRSLRGTAKKQPRTSEMSHKKARSEAGFGNLMVAREGIEPPTRGFSIPCSTN